MLLNTSLFPFNLSRYSGTGNHTFSVSSADNTAIVFAQFLHKFPSALQLIKFLSILEQILMYTPSRMVMLFVKKKKDDSSFV